MKKTIAAALLSSALLSGSALAGSLSDPILEEDLIQEVTTADGGILVPLFFLLLALPVVTG